MSIEAARLQASVGADTKGFDSGMAHADRTIKGAPSKWATALKVGGGAALAVGGALIVKGLVGAIQGGMASLTQQGVVVAQTNAVIKSTGSAANVTAAEIRNLSQALEDKTTVDDKVVQADANLLLTFTNVKDAAGAGNDIFSQTVSVFEDMKTAMPSSSMVMLGKALNDPITGMSALTRVGVTFSAQQKQQLKDNGALSKEEEKHYVALGKANKASAEQYKAGILTNKQLASQKIILAELNKEFGGSGAAFAATDAGKALAFQDAIEGVQQAVAGGLLPAMTRIRGSLTATFRDPATLASISAIGDSIAGIFSEGNLKTAASVMTTAAGAIGTAIKLFSSLPPQVQALAVGAIALKKITGIGPLDIVKGAGGLIKMVFERGATPANPLFVADVAGGVGGKLGGALPAAAGAAAGTGLALTTAVVAPLAVAAAATIIQGNIDKQAADLNAQTAIFAKNATDTDLANSIKGVKEQLAGMAFNTFDSKNKVVDVINLLTAEQNRRAGGSADRATAGGGNIPPAHGSADRATAGGGAVGIMATIPKNIMATLTAIGPGAAGVYQRGIHNGVAPSMSAVAATVARNVAATSAVKAATAAAAAKTAAALGGVRGATAAAGTKTAAAALASAAAIRAKAFKATVLNRLTITAAPVTLTLNQRVLAAERVRFTLAGNTRQRAI